jgi:NAD(P) transhydrogenase subunit beta
VTEPTGLLGDAVLLAYTGAAALFALSLLWMSQVPTARRGNFAAGLGMLAAVAATLVAFHVSRVDLVVVGIVLGAAVGIPISVGIPMTAVPQRTALSHAFGSLGVALVGTADVLQNSPDIHPATLAVLAGEMVLGFLTFTGSVIAFAKLQEWLPGRPWLYPGRGVVTPALLVVAGICAAALVADPSSTWLLAPMAAAALGFGFLMVMAIGGADMPTVIAILNSFAGMSAAGLGFVLNNKLLIVAGTLDGASGFILAVAMCKAMNRSFAGVLFGGLGAKVEAAGSAAAAGRSAQVFAPEDAAIVLGQSRLVVIVLGYGMAVAQAQHVVKELSDALAARGTEVEFAVHPVAGRMPGHMNVLLAEANVPYEKLWEMERANAALPEADVALVVGANDVTNPAARNRPESPLYGMPILDVDKAKAVIFVKRSLGAGFSGADNELFYLPRTMMVLGDAKKVLTDVLAALKAA